jgi:hypothetical protein
LVVFCDEDSQQGPCHAPFKLTRTGDRVYLVDLGTGSALDSLSFGLLPTDTSFGIVGVGTEPPLLGWPTPGEPNVPFPPALIGPAPELFSHLAGAFEPVPGSFCLRWWGDANALYHVEVSTDLNSRTTAPVPPSHLGQGLFRYVDYAPAPGGCFYRAFKE